MGDLKCICREVDKNEGHIAVYAMASTVTDGFLHRLSFRARLNPELRYFVTTDTRWNNPKLRERMTKLLSRKLLTKQMLDNFGGIVEL